MHSRSQTASTYDMSVTARRGERANKDVLKCNELFCNNQRIYSSIGYKAPVRSRANIA